MITIPIIVAGDHWLNEHEVNTSLAQSDIKEILIIDLFSEGPCLHRLGVIETLLSHCKVAQRDPQTIYIKGWSNPVEQTPFRRTHRSDISHFYWASDNYWPDNILSCEQGYWWGFFMGRPTLPRIRLLQMLAMGKDALLSTMRGGMLCSEKGTNLDLEEFGNSEDLVEWYHQCNIPSLDGASIRDQYSHGNNTNLSLLGFYDQFHVEVVAESYIYGETFLPTEKTVRPLAAGKPLIAMAAPFFLRRLRDQGFRTWHNLWDESYDVLEGSARLSAITTVIADVQHRQAEIRPKLYQHAQHNRDVLCYYREKHRPIP